MPDRGGAYLRKGDYDHAIKDYDEALKINPKNEEGYLEARPGQGKFAGLSRCPR